MSAGKTLYILRHAKAETGTATQADADRALAPQGLAAASLIGKHMRAKGIQPDLVLCSSSLRTRETLEQIQQHFIPRLPEQIMDRMYNASANEILTLLSIVPDELQNVLVIAHNPGLHQLSLKLAKTGDDKKLDTLAMKFPTASFVTISLGDSSWSAASKGGELIDFITPAALGGVDD